MTAHLPTLTDGPSQNLDLNPGYPGILHPKSYGGGAREIDDSAGHVGPTIVYLYLDRFSIRDVGHFDRGPQG